MNRKTKKTKGRIFGFFAGCVTTAFLLASANAAVVVVDDLSNLAVGESGSFAHFTTLANAGQLSGDGQVIRFGVNATSAIDSSSTSISLLDLVGIDNFNFTLIESTSPR